MKQIISLWLCALSFTAFAQNRSIQFDHMTFAEAMAKAKKENKLIFIDAYTTWCGPCKWMAKNMFTKDQIADYYNANFINAKFDMEKGEGIDLAKRYDVRCYPNLLFIDGDGNLVHRSAGAAENVEDYIALGETAKNPEKRFSKFLEQYESRKNESAFLASYINALSMTCLPMDELVNSYFAMQKEDELMSEENWKMISSYLTDMDSREFTYLIQHKNQFSDKYSAKDVNGKIKQVCLESANGILYAKDFVESDFAAYKTKVKNLNFDGVDGVLFQLQLSYLEKMGDMNAFFDYAIVDGDRYFELDQLNSICWAIFENSENEKHLNKAENWMKKLTDSEGGANYMNMDTYAAILFKLKKKQLAKEKAEQAIKLAIAEGMPESDYQATKDLLAKIEKLK